MKRREVPVEPKPPPRSRRYERAPWNDPDTPLELYISPDLKLSLGLRVKTTAEYREEREP